MSSKFSYDERTVSLSASNTSTSVLQKLLRLPSTDFSLIDIDGNKFLPIDGQFSNLVAGHTYVAQFTIAPEELSHEEAISSANGFVKTDGPGLEALLPISEFEKEKRALVQKMTASFNYEEFYIGPKLAVLCLLLTFDVDPVDRNGSKSSLKSRTYDLNSKLDFAIRKTNRKLHAIRLLAEDTNRKVLDAFKLVCSRSPLAVIILPQHEKTILENTKKCTERAERLIFVCEDLEQTNSDLLKSVRVEEQQLNSKKSEIMLAIEQRLRAKLDAQKVIELDFEKAEELRSVASDNDPLLHPTSNSIDSGISCLCVLKRIPTYFAFPVHLTVCIIYWPVWILFQFCYINLPAMPWPWHKPRGRTGRTNSQVNTLYIKDLKDKLEVLKKEISDIEKEKRPVNESFTVDLEQLKRVQDSLDRTLPYFHHLTNSWKKLRSFFVDAEIVFLSQLKPAFEKLIAGFNSPQFEESIKHELTSIMQAMGACFNLYTLSIITEEIHRRITLPILTESSAALVDRNNQKTGTSLDAAESRVRAVVDELVALREMQLDAEISQAFFE